MNEIRNKKRTALACELSVLVLALAALTPMSAAIGSVGVIAEARAQTNPCAPTSPAKTTPANPCAPRKAPPANPCAPQKAAPTNPCAPKKARPANPCAPKAIDGKDAKEKAVLEKCKEPVNPCAPKPSCDKDNTD